MRSIAAFIHSLMDFSSPLVVFLFYLVIFVQIVLFAVWSWYAHRMLRWYTGNAVPVDSDDCGKFIRTKINGSEAAFFEVDISSCLTLSIIENYFDMCLGKDKLYRHCLSIVKQQWMGQRYKDACVNVFARYFDRFVRGIANNSSTQVSYAANDSSCSKIYASLCTFGFITDHTESDMDLKWDAMSVEFGINSTFYPLDLLCFKNFNKDGHLSILDELLSSGSKCDAALANKVRSSTYYSKKSMLCIAAAFNKHPFRVCCGMSIALKRYLVSNDDGGVHEFMGSNCDISERARRVDRLCRYMAGNPKRISYCSRRLLSVYHPESAMRELWIIHNLGSNDCNVF